MKARTSEIYNPYRVFTRNEWAKLTESTPRPLTKEEIIELQGLNEQVSIDEVESVYLPLSQLLNEYAISSKQLHKKTDHLLQKQTKKVPYIIGIAGSVAVGKSTTARLLQALLKRSPEHPKVELVTTDGFLYPNATLKEKGIMNRKGFPESYDIERLIHFLADLKSGYTKVTAPVYSHLYYDILPDEVLTVEEPDIVIVEGINVLQVPQKRKDYSIPQICVSDFFDFSIYVDGDEQDITNWYLERFNILRETAFQNPNSYFHRYANISDKEAHHIATDIWNNINRKNLHRNILPTRTRAHLILKKGPDHAVSEVKVRKL